MKPNQVIKKINTFYRSALGVYKAADLLRAIRLEIEIPNTDCYYALADRLLTLVKEMEKSGPCPEALHPVGREVSQEEWDGIIDGIIKEYRQLVGIYEITITFTNNELAAIKAIYADCLSNMGGKNLADLQEDPFTWCSVHTLVDAGWSLPAAKGTISSLQEKRAVFSSGDDENKMCTHVLNIDDDFMVEMLSRIDEEEK